MTTVQFTYMMGVLWLIFAGTLFSASVDEGIALGFLIVFVGLAHIGLAITMFVWQFFRQST